MSVSKFGRSGLKIGAAELCWSVRGLMNSLGDAGEGIRSWGLGTELLTTSVDFFTMSILATLSLARTVFTAPNSRDKITRWDNHLHTSSRINPMSPYPSWYQVRPRIWSILGDNLLIVSWCRFCNVFSQISSFQVMSLWTPRRVTNNGIVTLIKTSTTTTPYGRWIWGCRMPLRIGVQCCSMIQHLFVFSIWVFLTGIGKTTIFIKPCRPWGIWPYCQVTSSTGCWRLKTLGARAGLLSQ